MSCEKGLCRYSGPKKLVVGRFVTLTVTPASLACCARTVADSITPFEIALVTRLTDKSLRPARRRETACLIDVLMSDEARIVIRIG